MELDAQDLKQGLKFIVGTWQVDYLVNAFSNDLAHIPAAEFKSDDGRDFSAITYEFFEDHTLVMKDTSTGKEEKGTWEQTGYGSFHYTLGAFMDLPQGAVLDAVEKLEMRDGTWLVFALGFLAVALKKVVDGVVTEEKKTDIGDLPGDDSMKEIVGTYEVAMAKSFNGSEFVLMSKEEVLEDLEKRAVPEEERRMYLMAFETRTEFTDDHKVITWMKIPAGVPKEEIDKAIASGELGEVKDGWFCPEGAKEWKAVDGKYYYDTKEHRELFGEIQSSWDELKVGGGMIEYADGMLVLKKV